MDKKPSNSEAPFSETNDDDNNIPKLGLLAERQQQQTNKIASRLCNDVLYDVLRFLRRTEHAQVRLANRRLQWLSNSAYSRLPPRVVHRLEVRGVAHPIADGGSSPRMVANSMRVHPPSGDSHLVDFPTLEPPEDIVQLSELEIHDFVSPELLQFLGLSARLMDNCWMMFEDFDNFIRHHSTEFIVRFFALFPSPNRVIELNSLSSLATPLLVDHPTIFDCNYLIVDRLDQLSLDALQGWLHLYEQQPPAEQQQKMGRYVLVRFEDELEMEHSSSSVDTAGHFVQQLREHFLHATSCCPFTVEIDLFGGEFDAPELQPFVEHNERTGELLEFSLDYLYSVKRRPRESAGQEEGDGEAETEEMPVYIHKVVQGDKQQMVDSEAED